jgi:hypothetical protein
MIAAFSLVFAERIASFLNLTLALTGTLVGFILIFLQGRGSGLERFYALGAMSIVLGTALSISSLPDGYGLGLFYGLMGFTFMVSGLIVLRRYLQDNPFPAEDERE